jgi:hypothetical protein
VDTASSMDGLRIAELVREKMVSEIEDAVMHVVYISCSWT